MVQFYPLLLVILPVISATSQDWSFVATTYTDDFVRKWFFKNEYSFGKCMHQGLLAKRRECYKALLVLGSNVPFTGNMENEEEDSDASVLFAEFATRQYHLTPAFFPYAAGRLPTLFQELRKRAKLLIADGVVERREQFEGIARVVQSFLNVTPEQAALGNPSELLLGPLSNDPSEAKRLCVIDTIYDWFNGHRLVQSAVAATTHFLKVVLSDELIGLLLAADGDGRLVQVMLDGFFSDPSTSGHGPVELSALFKALRILEPTNLGQAIHHLTLVNPGTLFVANLAAFEPSVREEVADCILARFTRAWIPAEKVELLFGQVPLFAECIDVLYMSRDASVKQSASRYAYQVAAVFGMAEWSGATGWKVSTLPMFPHNANVSISSPIPDEIFLLLFPGQSVEFYGKQGETALFSSQSIGNPTVFLNHFASTSPTRRYPEWAAMRRFFMLGLGFVGGGGMSQRDAVNILALVDLKGTTWTRFMADQARHLRILLANGDLSGVESVLKELLGDPVSEHVHRALTSPDHHVVLHKGLFSENDAMDKVHPWVLNVAHSLLFGVNTFSRFSNVTRATLLSIIKLSHPTVSCELFSAMHSLLQDGQVSCDVLTERVLSSPVSLAISKAWMFEFLLSDREILDAIKRVSGGSPRELAIEGLLKASLASRHADTFWRAQRILDDLAQDPTVSLDRLGPFLDEKSQALCKGQRPPAQQPRFNASRDEFESSIAQLIRAYHRSSYPKCASIIEEIGSKRDLLSDAFVRSWYSCCLDRHLRSSRRTVDSSQTTVLGTAFSDDLFLWDGVLCRTMLRKGPRTIEIDLNPLCTKDHEYVKKFYNHFRDELDWPDYRYSLLFIGCHDHDLALHLRLDVLQKLCNDQVWAMAKAHIVMGKSLPESARVLVGLIRGHVNHMNFAYHAKSIELLLNLYTALLNRLESAGRDVKSFAAAMLAVEPEKNQKYPLNHQYLAVFLSQYLDQSPSGKSVGK